MSLVNGFPGRSTDFLRGCGCLLFEGFDSSRNAILRVIGSSVKIICSVHILYSFRLDRFLSPIPMPLAHRCFRVYQQFAARPLTGSGQASKSELPELAKAP
jgi:hypothetical protein